MITVICDQCRTELDAAMVICPGCGSRVTGKRQDVDWRQQVRETVERHKLKKRREQARRDDDARQLTIFPDASEDEEERAARQRRAEIRARVEQRVSKRADTPSLRPPREAGEISLSSAVPTSRAATAPELEQAPEHAPLDAQTTEYEPVLDAGVSDDPELTSTEAPESFVAFGLAGAGERILGGLIDIAFVALIQLTLFYLTTHLVAQRLGALPTSAVVALSLVGTVLATGYFLFFWSLSGQTLGKLLLGIRVVDTKGRALGFGRAALRLLGCLAALLPLGAGLVGLWTDLERRGWHDRIAGSKVVRG